MEIKQINQLMLAMRRAGFKKLRIKHNDFELELESENGEAQTKTVRSLDSSGELEENPMKGDFEKTKSPVQGDQKAETEELCHYVTSPMVGTFYMAPSPKDKPFVQVGDRVEKNSVICIVEAMKVLNEIKSQVSGVVQEVLVNNGTPVEFGTKLFKIMP